MPLFQCVMLLPFSLPPPLTHTINDNDPDHCGRTKVLHRQWKPVVYLKNGERKNTWKQTNREQKKGLMWNNVSGCIVRTPACAIMRECTQLIVCNMLMTFDMCAMVWVFQNTWELVAWILQCTSSVWTWVLLDCDVWWLKKRAREVGNRTQSFVEMTFEESACFKSGGEEVKSFTT